MICLAFRDAMKHVLMDSKVIEGVRPIGNKKLSTGPSLCGYPGEPCRGQVTGVGAFEDLHNFRTVSQVMLLYKLLHWINAGT